MDIEKQSNRPTRPKRGGGGLSNIKKRYIIGFLTTICPLVCYISRQNLNMAVVAMIKDVHENDALAISSLNSTIAQQQSPNQHQLLFDKKTGLPYDTCPEPNIVNDNGQVKLKRPIYGPRYAWTPSQKSFIFEAFSWTYVICQIPAARFAEKIGAKWALVLAAAGSSLVSLLSPWTASVSVYAFAFNRAILGLCQAALFPACYVLYSHWLPPFERSQALSILGVGSYIGSITSSTSTGYFIEQPSLGWEYAFYVPGLLCALWTLVWIWLGTSEPREHKSISLEEIEYIESKIRKGTQKQQSVADTTTTTAVTTTNYSDEPTNSTDKQIDWWKVFTSQGVWTMMLANFATDWPFTTIYVLLPTYLNDILHITPLKNGMINSTMYILYCISTPIVGSVSTLMTEKHLCGLSRLNVRKLFECGALFSQAVCFIFLPIIGCDTTVVLGILFAQIVTFSLVNGGEVQLPTELTIDFAGTIYALGNCFGSMQGFIVPRVHSLIVNNSHDRSQWNSYFYLTVAVTTIGGFIFLFFGKNDLEDYAKDTTNSSDNVANEDEKKRQQQQQVAEDISPFVTTGESNKKPTNAIRLQIRNGQKE